LPASTDASEMALARIQASVSPTALAPIR
jgi:hypothetical protein